MKACSCWPSADASCLSNTVRSGACCVSWAGRVWSVGREEPGEASPRPSTAWRMAGPINDRGSWSSFSLPIDHITTEGWCLSRRTRSSRSRTCHSSRHILTEIYRYHTCSCHGIEDRGRNTREVGPSTGVTGRRSAHPTCASVKSRVSSWPNIHAPPQSRAAGQTLHRDYPSWNARHTHTNTRTQKVHAPMPSHRARPRSQAVAGRVDCGSSSYDKTCMQFERGGSSYTERPLSHQMLPPTALSICARYRLRRAGTATPTPANEL
jgi:hypothetical protein